MGQLTLFCVAFYLPFAGDAHLGGPQGLRLSVQEAPPKTLTILLLRHAEKVDASQDPELSTAGKQRSELLVKMLNDLPIEKIHTTNFVRTRDTVTPLAKAKGLKPEFYNPRELEVFAEKLKREEGVHVIVGHSNTTPDLVARLGGDPGEPIVEATEYDRLYIVTLVDGVPASSMVLRFGQSGR